MKRIKRTKNDAARPIVRSCTVDARKVWETTEFKNALFASIRARLFEERQEVMEK